MGRKTAESLGRSLAGRVNLVLTRQSSAPYSDMIAVGSLQQAALWAEEHGYDSIWVIGGGDIYSQTIELASTLVISHVNTVIDEADTHFPIIGDEWRDIEHTYHPQSERNAHAFDVVIYEK